MFGTVLGKAYHFGPSRLTIAGSVHLRGPTVEITVSMAPFDPATIRIPLNAAQDFGANGEDIAEAVDAIPLVGRVEAEAFVRRALEIGQAVYRASETGEALQKRLELWHADKEASRKFKTYQKRSEAREAYAHAYADWVDTALAQSQEVACHKSA